MYFLSASSSKTVFKISTSTSSLGYYFLMIETACALSALICAMDLLRIG